jgi:adenylate cyclase
MSRERPLIERVVHTAYLLSGTMDFKQLISRESPLVQFLMDCKEVVISSDYRENFFSELFIHDAMKSAAALPLVSGEFFFGFLLINTRKRDFFNNEKLQFLEGVNKMASGLMHNSKTHDELKKYLEEIEALKKYQDSIFSSLSNLLVTVDKEGTIRYFNKMAHEKMGFNDSQIGLPFHEFLKEKMEKKTITRLKSAHSKKNTLLGVDIQLFPKEWNLNIFWEY